MDHCTRPARLERMVFHDSCMANGLDAAAPLLADLFHLLYAHTYHWGSEKALSPKARLVWAYLLDGLQDNGQFAALHHLCRGEDSAAMEAARTVRQALSEAVQGIDRAAGRLLPVLERLTRRHDTAAERLYHLVRDAQADPARTPEALRAAAETASTAEQIQAVSGMIRDKLRKRQAETEAAVHTALQQGMDAASLARYVRRCWGDGASENAAQQAAHDREMLDRVKRNEMLLGITRQLGRMKEMLSELRKNDYAHGRGEKYSITRGRDLKNLLSGELALLASPATTPLFLRKYNAKGLLQYAKRERIHKGHGGIIVCLDESGSTKGENAEWGKALALAVQDSCAHEGRKFALVHFSSAGQIRTDRFLPGQYTAADLLSAAEHFFDGGTDFEAPVREALRLINEEEFEDADILFITDGKRSISDELAEQLQDAIQDTRCSVVGLLLDADNPELTFSLDKFCERVYRTGQIAESRIEAAVLDI
ncbi:hypothetical protein OCV66_14110 [Agathobaculum ammoniilyticum]|uniref:VWA domain-containing protein n=1 Tax=Agathobaculum ammoniilyticum TaxID=2981778 RepID=A0ABT2U6G1_9FIRM|nr:hypothetical protein [Agathobaculum ammoniilyticum]MCU6790215.1 hypothetical protein [Agathobaculum ammoniilyticum]